MALKATVIKAHLQIADMDRGYYQDHHLTLARHPSETDERLMVRLVAFALNASSTLAFSKGLSDEGEPELQEREMNGDISLWVDFGQSDEKWLRKASGRARKVKVYAYGGRSVPVWWQQNRTTLARFDNLEVWEIPEASVKAMAQFVRRSIQLQCNISEGQILLCDDETSLTVEPVLLKE